MGVPDPDAAASRFGVLFDISTYIDNTYIYISYVLQYYIYHLILIWPLHTWYNLML